MHDSRFDLGCAVGFHASAGGANPCPGLGGVETAEAGRGTGDSRLR